MATRRQTKVMVDVFGLDSLRDLMQVQFGSVKDNFDRVHTTMAELKNEQRADKEALDAKIEGNRKTAEERHLGLIKKVWYGAGVVAAFQFLLQFASCHLQK